jgi:hypothetical protein
MATIVHSAPIKWRFGIRDRSSPSFEEIGVLTGVDNRRLCYRCLDERPGCARSKTCSLHCLFVCLAGNTRPEFGTSRTQPQFDSGCYWFVKKCCSTCYQMATKEKIDHRVKRFSDSYAALRRLYSLESSRLVLVVRVRPFCYRGKI